MSRTIHRPDEEAMRRVLDNHPRGAAGLVLRLAWLEGLTREEISALQWENVSFETRELQLKNRTIPLNEEVEQCLQQRFSAFAQRSPYVAISDRFRDAMHPVYISRLARDAMDEEESLKNVRLVDLHHDFIIRQLETQPWPYVARISGYTVTSFQAAYSPYIKVKEMNQKELQGDDEYRIWQVLQAEKGTMEGLALALRWYMNVGVGEMVEITWEQVDFERDCIHLQDRDVALASPVRKALLAASQQRKEGEDPHVLLKENARTPMDISYLSRRVRTVMLRNGVDDIQFRDVCRETEKMSDKTKLLELAKEKPGFSRSDAMKATGLTKGTLYRRLCELLEEKKLVRVGMMYYLAGTVVTEEERDHVVRDYLQEHGTATIADLQFLLRIERRQCGRVLKKMVDAGKLTREGNAFKLPLGA